MRETRVKDRKELIEALKEGYEKINLMNDETVMAFIRLKRNYTLVKTFTIVFSFFTIFVVYFAMHEAMGYPLQLIAIVIIGIITAEIVSLYFLDKSFKPMLSYQLKRENGKRYVLLKKGT